MAMNRSRRVKRARRTMHRRRRGGQMPIYQAPSQLLDVNKDVTQVATATKGLADTVGDTVADAVRSTQASYIRGKDKVRQTSNSFMSALTGFGSSVTQKLSSLFSGGARKRRHGSRKSRKSHRRGRR